MWEDSLCAVYKGTKHSLRILQVKMKDDNKKDYCAFVNPWQSERFAPYCAIGN
jgi:hypothetical protein